MDHPQPTTTTPSDPTTIVKRKRSKRQRPTTHSSTSSYSDFPATAEDEDTANCLILLSKGQRHNNNNNNNNNNIVMDHEFKFNSKRYIQTVDTGNNGCTGIYVYECKTCSRTFSSFQALGGHRASHMKPKILINESVDHSSKQPVCDEDDDTSQLQFKKHNNNVSSSSNSSLIRVSSSSPKKSSSKIHECSICGAEFNSGQALGGHMRRHRATNGGVTATNTTLSLVPYGSVVTAVTVDDDDGDRKSRNDGGLCLTLDLNLPAPPETTVGVSDQAQHRETSFKFPGNQNKQQQPSVHLSAAPTLVDCHY